MTLPAWRLRALALWPLVCGAVALVALAGAWALGFVAGSGALRVAALLVGADAAWLAIQAVRTWAPPLAWSRLHQIAAGQAPAPVERPPLLARLEAIANRRGVTGADLHTVVRPMLRRIVSAAFEVEAFPTGQNESPLAAECGPALWDLVRDDRPRPDTPWEREMSVTELEAVVAAAERVLDR